MSAPEEPTPETNLGAAKTRLPFAEKGAPAPGGSFAMVWKIVLSVITLGCLGLALYMKFYMSHGWTDPHVVAPAIGVVWFGARLLAPARQKS